MSIHVFLLFYLTEYISEHSFIVYEIRYYIIFIKHNILVNIVLFFMKSVLKFNYLIFVITVLANNFFIKRVCMISIFLDYLWCRYYKIQMLCKFLFITNRLVKLFFLVLWNHELHDAYIYFYTCVLLEETRLSLTKTSIMVSCP